MSTAITRALLEAQRDIEVRVARLPKLGFPDGRARLGERDVRSLLVEA